MSNHCCSWISQRPFVLWRSKPSKCQLDPDLILQQNLPFLCGLRREHWFRSTNLEGHVTVLLRWSLQVSSQWAFHGKRGLTVRIWCPLTDISSHTTQTLVVLGWWLDVCTDVSQMLLMSVQLWQPRPTPPIADWVTLTAFSLPWTPQHSGFRAHDLLPFLTLNQLEESPRHGDWSH